MSGFFSMRLSAGVNASTRRFSPPRTMLSASMSGS